MHVDPKRTLQTPADRPKSGQPDRTMIMTAEAIGSFPVIPRAPFGQSLQGRVSRHPSQSTTLQDTKKVAHIIAPKHHA